MTILNHGYKGQVMDVYNRKDKKDTDTLYYELLSSKSKKLKLITIDGGKYIRINKRKDVIAYENILETLRNMDGILVKKFIYISYIFGTKKHNFNNELDGYKSLIKIFKDKIEEHTTIKEGFTYKGRKIYGMIFNNDYYIFLEKCFKNLEEIKFTQSLLDKCTKEIMETLNILNGNNYIHNDLKPNNIILCKNRFKIIDWESSNEVRKQSTTIIDTKNGNIVFNHPLKFYNKGIPYFLYQYMYDIDFVHYKFLVNKKAPKELKEKIDSSMDELYEKSNKLSYKNSKLSITNYRTIDEIEENKYYYLKLYDYYAFAVTIYYLAEVNKLNYNKKIINSIFKKFLIKMI